MGLTKQVSFTWLYDKTGSWDASNIYDLNEFLDTKEGGLESLIGETIAYSKNYLEE